MQGFEHQVEDTRRRYPFLEAAFARRITRAYGVLVPQVLGTAKTREDLGRNFGADLTEAEVCYLVQREWAMTATDIVWRRTKLGLRLSLVEIATIDEYLKQSVTAPRAAE